MYHMSWVASVAAARGAVPPKFHFESRIIGAVCFPLVVYANDLVFLRSDANIPLSRLRLRESGKFVAFVFFSFARWIFVGGTGAIDVIGDSIDKLPFYSPARWPWMIAQEYFQMENEEIGSIPYNPHMAQYLEISGNIGHVNRNTKTVVCGPGEDADLITHLLQCLSYFIRCSVVQASQRS